MKNRVMFLLLLAALLPIAFGCGDKPVYGTIKGYVRDIDNSGLPGVTVTAYKTDDPDPVKSAVTNASGEYTLSSLEAGVALNLEYIKDGYDPGTTSGIILEKKEFRMLPDEVMTPMAGTVTISGTVVLE